MKAADRYVEIDLLRTLAIAMMVLYHLAFDLASFYDVPLDPRAGGWLILQRITANLFLGLVGISFAVSWGRMDARHASFAAKVEKYGRRSMWLFAAAFLVTMLTYVWLGDLYVRFGILHLIAVSVLLLTFLMPLGEWNIVVGMAVFLLGPIMGSASWDGYGFLLPFGIMPSSFASIDYFPLFPWFSAVLIGAAAGNMFYNRTWGDAPWCGSAHHRPGRPYDNNRGLLPWHVPSTRLTELLAWPGRYSLWIYLIHQPVLLAGLWWAFR